VILINNGFIFIHYDFYRFDWASKIKSKFYLYSYKKLIFDILFISHGYCGKQNVVRGSKIVDLS
jgi:hypothetical protein